MIPRVSPPNLSAATLHRFAATLPGQLTGLVLVLAPAVVHPLGTDGGTRTVVQILAVIGGFAGTLLVFGGMGSLYQGSVSHPRTVWSTGLVLAAGLHTGAGACLARELTGGGHQYLPATIMFLLPALALSLLLWLTRASWAQPQAGFAEAR